MLLSACLTLGFLALSTLAHAQPEASEPQGSASIPTPAAAPTSARRTSPGEPPRPADPTPSPSGAPSGGLHSAQSTTPAGTGPILGAAPDIRDERYLQPDTIRAKDPMGVFGIGLRMGVALWGTRTFESALDRVLDDSGAGDQLATAEALGVDTGLPQGAEDIAIAPGPSMLLALPINLGGVVFFRMEPMLTAGEFTTLGGYMGLGANIHLKRAYISIGVGGMGDLLLDDRFEVAADLYFRVPIDVYWYVLDDFGLFVELAGGAGISVAQPAGAQDVSTAGGTMFDFSLGLRVP